jgi:hypothetical protein
MCGARLVQKVSAVPIDDNDPLDLEAPVYAFEDRSRSTVQSTADIRDRDRQRERMRDSAPTTRPARSANNPSFTSVTSFPPDTVQEEAVEEEKAPRHASGIGGPSFLGLGYEGSNDGFVYDKPRNDGFIYDSDGEAPEYLLDETRRRSTWRAWAFVLLLVVGGGLGYIQWRANHNQGPDIASILSGNGATVDPNHPVVDGANTKPPAAKADAPAADATKTDSDATNSTDKQKSAADSTAKPTTSSDSDTSAKAASPKSGDANEENDSTNASAPAAKPDAASGAKDRDDGNKPESDGPSTNSAKPTRTGAAHVAEKTPQPKSLGEKDPLIIAADRYLQGRGVRQNCSTGVNLLRQAMSAGNPAAEVKMGALYWSGTCVTKSNVTAYEWFSRAHSLDPQNRWIERSRNSLWASMSSAERQKVSY